MSTKYNKYWEACDPYDKFLSEEEKRKHESEVLSKHPEHKTLDDIIDVPWKR